MAQRGVMPPDQDDETWRPGSEGMSLSCREDRMMRCGIVLRQHRNVTDVILMPYSQLSIQIDGWLKIDREVIYTFNECLRVTVVCMQNNRPKFRFAVPLHSDCDTL